MNSVKKMKRRLASSDALSLEPRRPGNRACHEGQRTTRTSRAAENASVGTAFRQSSNLSMVTFWCQQVLYVFLDFFFRGFSHFHSSCSCVLFLFSYHRKWFSRTCIYVSHLFKTVSSIFMFSILIGFREFFAIPFSSLFSLI